MSSRTMVRTTSGTTPGAMAGTRSRTTRSARGAAGLVLAGVAALAPATALADDGSAELADRVRRLEAELATVKAEAARGGYFTATSDLEARVAELERAAGDSPVSGAFKAGLRFESADSAFRTQWYGLTQNDWIWAWDDGDDDTEAALGDPMNPGTQFRRIRLGVTGQMYGNVRWQTEVEFSRSSLSLADVWIELANCGFGSIRVGHQKEPIGFDQLASDRFVQFMERSFVNTLSPVRNTGVLLHGPVGGDAWLYQVGMFRDADGTGADTGNAKAGEYNLTARISGRPIVDEESKSWLHVGVSGRLTDNSDDAFTLGAKPAQNMAPNFLTVSAPVSDSKQVGLEAAYVTGPFTFLAEAGRIDCDVIGGSDSSIDALSVEASYWLTGESTAYDKGKGSFGRTSPKRNFGDGDGAGAWQIALRWDTISLDDGAFAAGEMDQWTLGVKWWLNPNTDVMLNLVHVKPDDAAGLLDAVTFVGVRFDLDF